jgi:hypothetical protein
MLTTKRGSLASGCSDLYIAFHASNPCTMSQLLALLSFLVALGVPAMNQVRVTVSWLLAPYVSQHTHV